MNLFALNGPFRTLSWLNEEVLIVNVFTGIS